MTSSLLAAVCCDTFNCERDDNSHYVAAIACLLRKPVTVQRHTLAIEEIDLSQVYQPYLIVRGLPPFMSEQKEFLKSHFETLSSTKIQSLDVRGSEASIHFVDRNGMLCS